MPRTDDPSRDLLYGLLALQVGMIEQAQLVAAFQAWIRNKSRPMAGLLADEAEQTFAAATRSIGDNAPAYYELARYEACGAERLAQAGGDAPAVEPLDGSLTVHPDPPRSSQLFPCAQAPRPFVQCRLIRTIRAHGGHSDVRAPRS